MNKTIGRILEDALLLAEVSAEDLVARHEEVSLKYERAAAHVIARRVDALGDASMDAAIAACVEGVCKLNEYCLPPAVTDALFERFKSANATQEFLPDGWTAIEPIYDEGQKPVKLIVRAEVLDEEVQADLIAGKFSSRSFGLPENLGRHLMRGRI